MVNLLIFKINELIRAKNSLMQDECTVDVTAIESIINTPFSQKVPFASTNTVTNKQTIDKNISIGVCQLATFYGFSETTDTALQKLTFHVEQLLGGFASQYRVSEVRRAKLQTAFKSSIQHILTTNCINDPGKLQLHFAEIFQRSQKIVIWWSNYIENPDDRKNEMIKASDGVI